MLNDIMGCSQQNPGCGIYYGTQFLQQILCREGGREMDGGQIPCDITYMWNLKYDTNEPIYKAETDSQTQKTALWLPMGQGEGEGWNGSLGLVNANYYI